MVLEKITEITTIPEGLINTALGMGTVFAVLILISFIISLLKFVPMLLSGEKKKEKDVKTAAPAPAAPAKAAPAPAVSASPAEDGQLVAVIAAAIAAQMTEETGVATAADGLVIRSIKKRTFSN